MSYTVSMRDSTISSSLRQDNLRGESRWERQVAEALLETGQPVHSLQGGSWQNNKPSNYHQGVPSTCGNSIALAHDLIEDFDHYKFKACIFNIYGATTLANKLKLIGSYASKYGRAAIFTHGYYNNQAQVEELADFVSRDHIEFLGAPSAPRVYESQDNFNSKRLVWISRGVHLHTFPGRENPDLDTYVTWIKEMLEADSQLELIILPGLSQADMDWQGWRCTVEQRIFESPIMQKLNSVRRQISVQTACGWDRILDIMSGAKLSVALDPTRFGGPPIESAMYGIPYVSPAGPTAFMGMDDYLYSRGTTHLLETYTKLLTDHSYYREHGDKVREHVKKYHTYEAFRNRLSEILLTRGIR